MAFKESILDLIHYLFIICFALFLFFYFFLGYRFLWVSDLVFKIALPLAGFSLIFLIKLKFVRNEIKRVKEEGLNYARDPDVVIELTVYDRLTCDIFIFALPVIIVIIAVWREVSVTTTDFIQASIAFILMYYWQKFLFRKRAR